jgi:hypothetical protein
MRRGREWPNEGWSGRGRQSQKGTRGDPGVGESGLSGEARQAYGTRVRAWPPRGQWTASFPDGDGPIPSQAASRTAWIADGHGSASGGGAPAFLEARLPGQLVRGRWSHSHTVSIHSFIVFLVRKFRYLKN